MAVSDSEDIMEACLKRTDGDMGNTVADSLALDALLEMVYRDSGYDFREYRRGTVIRRLQRRLYLAGARTYSEYRRFLKTHPEEYQRLADYLTIKVSGFFRNQYAFQQVAGLVLPELLANKRGQGQRALRFWSAACARGEEPYSMAIILAEFLGDRQQDFDIEIHATDMSQSALLAAQAGLYSNKEVGGLSPGILEKYFICRDEGYAVSGSIRQMVSCSHFDLVSTITPPFTDVDCIFCCNILIYLQKQIQEKVLAMLYNALATPGYLVLGEVETPTDNLRQKLECLDARARIYKKV